MEKLGYFPEDLSCPLDLSTTSLNIYLKKVPVVLEAGICETGTQYSDQPVDLSKTSSNFNTLVLGSYEPTKKAPVVLEAGNCETGTQIKNLQYSDQPVDFSKTSTPESWTTNDLENEM